jgi:hypothetical protein
MTEWKCLGCGAHMHHELVPAASAVANRVGEIRHQQAVLIHVCGRCKTLHLQAGDALRKATPAEEFEIRTQSEAAMEAVDAMQFGPCDHPEGTIIIS